MDAVAERFGAHHAIAADLVERHALDGQHRALHLVEHVDHLPERRRRRVDHVVTQHHGERLIAHEVARDVDRVSEAEGRALPHRADARQRRHVPHGRELIELAALLEEGLEFHVDVEVVDHRRLAARGDHHDLVDAGLDGLFDRVLDDGLVDEGQHLLRHRLGRRKEPGAESRGREDGSPDAERHAVTFPLGRLGGR